MIEDIIRNLEAIRDYKLKHGSVKYNGEDYRNGFKFAFQLAIAELKAELK